MHKFEELLSKYTEKGLDDPQLNQEWVEIARDFLTKQADMDEDERTAADAEVTEKFNEMQTAEFIENAELTKVKQEVDAVKKNQQNLERQQKISELKAESKEDLKLTDIDKLAKAKEKYAEMPEIVKQIDLRIEAVKNEAQEKEKEKKKKNTPPPPAAESLEEKLRKFHGQELNYDQLEKLGVNPTGDHMTIGKVKLYRRALFFIYTVDAS